ncbi:MAG: hypothetical protein MUP22_04490 [Desulfobacterales bacterium]|nr:hypothetical protein [Desulfobacterales bacterium]
MTNDKNKKLGKLINSSGFLFQLAIQHLILKSQKQPWKVIAREHPWKDKSTGEGGFIDLILDTSLGLVFMVCECKRTRGGEWIFIVERNTPSEIIYVRCLWRAGLPSGIRMSGWDDIPFQPSSKESAFCVVRGNEKDPPLLERIAGSLLQSVDCLAEEDIEYTEKMKTEYKGVYIPAIITNAKLYICEVDPGEISIKEGELITPNFVEVPMIRFKKNLSLQEPPNAKANNLIEASKERERTVLVINSESLINILSSYNIKRQHWEGPHPWDEALSIAKQGPGVH